MSGKFITVRNREGDQVQINRRQGYDMVKLSSEGMSRKAIVQKFAQSAKYAATGDTPRTGLVREGEQDPKIEEMINEQCLFLDSSMYCTVASCGIGSQGTYFFTSNAIFHG